jgi:hypothetical protein
LLYFDESINRLERADVPLPEKAFAYRRGFGACSRQPSARMFAWIDQQSASFCTPFSKLL